MSLTLQADPVPLQQGDDGVIRVAGTRIPLERVVRAFLAGATAEQIAHDFDTLSLEATYAVINYFLHHRDEVATYLAQADSEAESLRKDIEQEFDSTGTRARLIARRGS